MLFIFQALILVAGSCELSVAEPSPVETFASYAESRVFDERLAVMCEKGKELCVAAALQYVVANQSDRANSLFAKYEIEGLKLVPFPMASLSSEATRKDQQRAQLVATVNTNRLFAVLGNRKVPFVNELGRIVDTCRPLKRLTIAELSPVATNRQGVVEVFVPIIVFGNLTGHFIKEYEFDKESGKWVLALPHCYELANALAGDEATSGN